MVCGGDKGLRSMSALREDALTSVRGDDSVVQSMPCSKTALAPQDPGEAEWSESLRKHFQRTLLPKRQKPIAFGEDVVRPCPV